MEQIEVIAANNSARTRRRSDYVVAAILVVLAAAISPPGVTLITGRIGLSFRVTIVCVAIDVFLMGMIAAVIAQGRWRRICFYVLACTFPLVLLAGLEAVADRIRFADVV